MRLVLEELWKELPQGWVMLRRTPDTMPRDGFIEMHFTGDVNLIEKVAQLEEEVALWRERTSIPKGEWSICIPHNRAYVTSDGCIVCENEALREGVKMGIALINHGDFRNGITGPNGLIDEGEVYAGRLAKKLDALLTKESE